MKFQSNAHIEEPFFHQLAYQLDGTPMGKFKGGKPIYQVRCPRCHKKKAKLCLGEQGNTYVFGCPVDGCNWGCNLHQLINGYGTDELRKEWQLARYQEDWLPIKNRAPSKGRQKGLRGTTSTPIKGMNSNPAKLQAKALIDGQQPLPQPDGSKD